MSAAPLQGAPADITPLRLQLFAPRCDYTSLAPKLDGAAKAKGITTPRRVRHWLGHLHVESAGLTTFEENLSYSAERLHAVWSRRFPTLESAAPFARNPRALANKVYGGRFGNVRPDDGWLFRGSSPIQLTFHDNYVEASAWTGLDLVAHPELARDPAAGCWIAACFWERHGLNEAADADAGERAIAGDIRASILANETDDIHQERHAINGGENGLDDVVQQVLRAGTIWRD